MGLGGGGAFCPCSPFSKQASLLDASQIFCARRPAPTIRLCFGSVVSGWGVWLGAAPVFGEGPLLRRRLSCILTLEQLRSVPSRGTVPIGLQTWLGLGGPDGCRSLLSTPCVCVCVCGVCPIIEVNPLCGSAIHRLRVCNGLRVARRELLRFPRDKSWSPGVTASGHWQPKPSLWDFWYFAPLPAARFGNG